MQTLVSYLRPVKEDRGLEFTVILGRSPVGLGDEVEYRYRDSIVGNRFISYRKVIKLSELESSDIFFLSHGLHDKRTLWAKLEKIYKMPIPGHYEITIIGLARSRDYWDEDLLRNNWSYEDNLEGDPGYIDQAELYEEEYEDLPSSERIRQKNEKNWEY